MARKYNQQDLGIDLNAPTETIDSPRPMRYDPVSYEGQIRAEEEAKAGRGEIAKGIAEIILYDNDYKKQEIYAKHQQDLNAQRVQDELELRNLEQDLAIEQGNIVADRLIKHSSDVNEAMKRADADKSLSRQALLQEVYDSTLAEADDLSPYARNMLEKSLQGTKQSDFSAARKADLDSMIADANVSIMNGVNNIANKIAMGNIDVEGGLQEFLQRTISPYVGVLGYDGLVDAVGKAFQEFCSSYINFLTSQTDRSADQIVEDVRSFVGSMQNKKIAFLTSEGEVALNSAGQEMSFEASINPDIAMKGMHNAASLRAGNEADTDYKIKNITQGFYTNLGWEDITNTGSSGSLSNLSLDDIMAMTMQTIQEINDGHFKEDKASPAKTEVYNAGMRAYTLRMMQLEAMRQKDIGTIRSFAAKLDADIKKGALGGIDWAHYTLRIGDTNIGIPYERLNPNDYGLPATTNAQAYEHWVALNSMFKSTLAGCTSVKDLNAKCSNTLRQQSANLEAIISTVDFEPGTNRIRQQDSDTLVKFFNQASLYSKGTYTVAPSGELSAMTQRMSNCSSLQQSMAMGNKFAETANYGGYGSQLITGLSNVIQSKGGQATGNEKMLALAFFGRRNSNVQTLIQNVIDGKGEVSLETANELLSSQLSIDEKQGILKMMDKYKVPAAYRPALVAACEAYNVFGGKDARKDNAVKILVKSNFYDLSGAGVSNRVFVGHPEFGTGRDKDPAVNMQSLQHALFSNKELVNVTGNRLGVSGNVGYTFNDEKGMFVLTKDGAPVVAHTRNGDVQIGLTPRLMMSMQGNEMGKKYLTTLYGLVQTAQGNIDKKWLTRIQDDIGSQIKPAEMDKMLHASVAMLTNKKVIAEIADGKRRIAPTVLGSSPELGKGGNSYRIMVRLLEGFTGESRDQIQQKKDTVYPAKYDSKYTNNMDAGYTSPLNPPAYDSRYMSPLKLPKEEPSKRKVQPLNWQGPVAPNPYYKYQKSDASDGLYQLAAFIAENMTYCGKINLSKDATYSITKSAVLGDDYSLNLAAFNHDNDYTVS